MLMKRLYKEEEGAAAALLAALIFVLIALAGLVLDGGLLMYSRTKLEAAAEAAAMSTIEAYNKELWEEEGIVKLNQIRAEKYARQYLARNLAKAKIESVEINKLKENQAIVKAKLDVDLIFMRIFGVEKKTVRTVVKSVGS